MNKKIIKSIELNIGDTSVNMSQKQLRTLFEALSELFGEPKIAYQPYPYRWVYGTGVYNASQTMNLGSDTAIQGIKIADASFNGSKLPESLTIQ